MKQIALILFIFTSLKTYAQVADVEIFCGPNRSVPEVKSMQLNSRENTVSIDYKNGDHEILKAEAGVVEGVFQDLTFVADVAKGHGQVLTESAKLGTIVIRHQCFVTPDIYTMRCTSQGDYSEAAYSQVEVNIEGQRFTYHGRNICDRKPLAN